MYLKPDFVKQTKKKNENIYKKSSVLDYNIPWWKASRETVSSKAQNCIFWEPTKHLTTRI